MDILTEKPKLKTITSEPRLSFNEWAEKFNVSTHYIEPTIYFKGNPSSGVRSKIDTRNFVEKFMDLFTSKHSKKF
jgi:hypothetical protein